MSKIEEKNSLLATKKGTGESKLHYIDPANTNEG